MPQFDIYPNPGQKKLDIPYLVVIQNNHISSRTGTSVVIPLRANSQPTEIIYPLVAVPGVGAFVLSSDEIFAIDNTRLRNPVGALSLTDRAKIRPAIDKVIGEY
ncbi:MAG: CcdB family protein [Dechloromonas sp.]|jgi:mRNA-degrading endonuclease toxin of MazEF toxin-antitoxin module|nr:CcdB family protein [Dechloromonas sp.]MBN8463305.1 CcdB family protein [Dechloromonas sp.]